MNKLTLFLFSFSSLYAMENPKTLIPYDPYPDPLVARVHILGQFEKAQDLAERIRTLRQQREDLEGKPPNNNETTLEMISLGGIAVGTGQAAHEYRKRIPLGSSLGLYGTGAAALLYLGTKGYYKLERHFEHKVIGKGLDNVRIELDKTQAQLHEALDLIYAMQQSQALLSDQVHEADEKLVLYLINVHQVLEAQRKRTPELQKQKEATSKKHWWSQSKKK
jgi:hypothetical protein